MRIAFAMINCNRRDGSARAVNEVAERLARRGHDVHLYARRAEDLDLSLIHWHRIPGPGWPEIADFSSYHSAVNRALRRHDFDIVHSIGCNTLRANVVTIQNIQPAKRAILARFAAAERVSLPRRFTRWLYLRATSAAERRLYTHRPGRRLLFLPVSQGVEAELRDHYLIGDSPVRIVPNAADTGIFHPVDPSARSAWRSAHGFSDQDVVAIFSGGEWARKGLDFAIRALAHSRQPGMKLFVAGGDPDSARFAALASSCGVADRVIFGGFRRDIPLALASCDLFLFPSHYEAFSLATIEAAACGLPILASCINGTEDFIQPGLTGDFIDHDPLHIASLLDQWAASPSRRAEAGHTARLLVDARYTWHRVTDLTEDAYRSLLS